MKVGTQVQLKVRKVDAYYYANPYCNILPCKGNRTALTWCDVSNPDAAVRRRGALAWESGAVAPLAQHDGNRH